MRKLLISWRSWRARVILKITLVTLGGLNLILGILNFISNQKTLREEKRQTNMMEEVEK